ncbi:MAG: S8 family serine peptidase [Planctomycetes bacterium]|nr:S8 family serine peptidase [Planctomycetota bacterium]
MDPIIGRSLDNFGFAQVLVMLKQDDQSTAKASAKKGPKSVMNHFLSELPEAVAGLATSAGSKRARATASAVSYFPLLGVILGLVDSTGMRRLAADKSVEGVHYADAISLIRPVHIAAAQPTSRMTWGLRRLGIPGLWKQGLTGQGVRVGHLDTGVDGKHPAVKNRITGFMEFDFNGNRVPGSSPHDTDEHGTHTAGTICGGKAGGMAIGVAPEADLFSGLVIEGGNALLRVLAGMEWTLEQQVRVLSMSLGFRGFTPFFLAVTRRLRQRGVLPVFAIGNEGVGTSRSPGNYAEALSVGAVDRNDTVAEFSSSIRFNRPVEPIQPNVVAPGVGVVSAKPGGGVQSMAGTSMATPHVAGVAALLFQAKPGATVAQVEQAIQSTCTPPPNQSPLRFGFGLVNPAAAVQALP